MQKLLVPQKQFRFLSRDEISLVLAQAPENIRPLILTAIDTGLRASELFKLEWSHIYFETGLLHVASTARGHTKSYKNRVIPMMEQLKIELTN